MFHFIIIPHPQIQFSLSVTQDCTRIWIYRTQINYNSHRGHGRLSVVWFLSYLYETSFMYLTLNQFDSKHLYNNNFT